MIGLQASPDQGGAGSEGRPRGSVSTWRSFLPYLRPYLGTLAWVLLGMLAESVVGLLRPWPLKLVIHYVIGGRPGSAHHPTGGGGGLLLPAFVAGRLTPLHTSRM